MAADEQNEALYLLRVALQKLAKNPNSQQRITQAYWLASSAIMTLEAHQRETEPA